MEKNILPPNFTLPNVDFDRHAIIISSKTELTSVLSVICIRKKKAIGFSGSEGIYS